MLAISIASTSDNELLVRSQLINLP